MQECSPPVYGENGKLLKVGSDLSHIAFIMDGNGRWAQMKGRTREYGHSKGVKAFEKVVKYCAEIGVMTVTVYAFSTENWKRPKKEIDKIMELLEKYLDKLFQKADEYDFKIRFIGERRGLSEVLVRKISMAERINPESSRTVNIALNYGSRSEITEAFNKLIRSGKTTVSEEDISGALYTAGVSDPDLIVRTAGEQRLSNFLMWQAAYSEFYFTETLWPEFDEAEVEKAVNAYYKRTRRYGGLV